MKLTEEIKQYLSDTKTNIIPRKLAESIRQLVNKLDSEAAKADLGPGN